MLLECLALVLILSLDAFAASLAYGADKIEIPPTSTAVISAICSLLLALSLAFGGLLAPLLSIGVIRWLPFSILLILGAVKLFDSSLKRLISKRGGQKLRLKAFRMKFILQIYADPSVADADSSRVLSAKEAASLAVAMSLDGLAIGFGAGLASQSPTLTFVLCFAITAMAVKAGQLAGKKLSLRLQRSMGWISGVFLILLALSKLLAA